MSDPAFEDFVTAKLDTLDELAGRYREYWLELIEDYWRTLCTLTEKEKPDGFEFHKKTSVIGLGEHRCGWTRGGDLPPVHAVIAVENILRPDSVRDKNWASWPLVNKCCWIGIQLYKNDAPDLHREISKRADVVFRDLEEQDNIWPAWRRLSIFSENRIGHLHAQLNAERQKSQADLVQELKCWVNVINDAENSLRTLAKPLN